MARGTGVIRAAQASIAALIHSEPGATFKVRLVRACTWCHGEEIVKASGARCPHCGGTGDEPAPKEVRKMLYEPDTVLGQIERRILVDGVVKIGDDCSTEDAEALAMTGHYYIREPYVYLDD